MIKEKEVLVRQILTQSPSTRDDYNKLISIYWSKELEASGNLQNTTLDFLRSMWRGELSSTESIARCRRKVQEVSPELRGRTYKYRQVDGQQQVLDDLYEMEKESNNG